jgi:hypothetical protein
LNAIWEAPDKLALIASRENSPHLLRTQHGQGEVYHTNLFTKLFMLALVKFTTLDPWGMGVEMEAGKPGWYDAMNGLPGIFGASMPETYELKRLMMFLEQALFQAVRQQGAFELTLPVEVCQLLDETSAHLNVYHASDSDRRDHTYWDAVSTAREAYRSATRLGLDGAEQALSAETLAEHLKAFHEKIDAGIQRALEINQGLPPTYFYYQVEDYEGLEENNATQEDAHSEIHFKVKRFKPVVMPLFLEGVVRAMKIFPQEQAATLFQQVKSSDLYDPKLKMYKVNASLENQPHHIGRARAFTPGWLENESIWLHMEYKYLLEVLRAGLVEEFFDDLKNALVPFQNPSVYRRSPLENSSFLVSSAHPDDALHGAGFVARLSGSTAEFLSIWQLMMVGETPFVLEENDLCLNLAPNLPGWLFSEDGKITFNFLGRCMVTYHNPGRKDLRTGGSQPIKFVLQMEGGDPKEIYGTLLPPPYAEKLRSGHIGRMDVFFDI